jgi:MFS family permease
VIFLSEAAIAVLLLAVNVQYPRSVLRVGAIVTGLAFSAYGAAKMPGQPFSGWLADRIDPRRVLIGGLALSLPVIALMERLHFAWSYVASWALFGLALAAVWPSAYAITGRRFRPAVQGRLLALISMAQIAGTATGTEAGAILVDHVSYSAAFGVAFVFQLLALLLALIVIPSDRPDRGPLSHADRPIPTTRGYAALRSIISINVAVLITVIMLVNMASPMLAPDLKPYSARVLHLKYDEFVLLLVPPAAIAALMLVPAGYVADRFGRNLPLLVGLLLFPCGLLAITFVREPLVAMLWGCVGVIGYVLCLPALNASLLDVSTERNRGLVTGVSTSIQAIGLVIGPIIGGALIDLFGPLAPFRAAVVVILAAFCLAIVYAARTRHLYREKLSHAALG